MYHFNARNFGLFTITIFISILNSSLVIPQIVKFESSSENLISLKFPQPPKSTLKNPQYTRGAAKRTCLLPENKEESEDRTESKDRVLALTALMPNSANYAKTTSSQLTFFLYVPVSRTDKLLEFSIFDEKGDYIDIQKIPLSKKEGIVKITISPEKELEIGNKYDWRFLLRCGILPETGGTQLTIKDPQIEEGIIERVNLKPEIESQLANTNDTLEKAKIYNREEIWLDTLSNLASVRDSQPEEWSELLKSIGLEVFSDRPLIDVGEGEN